MKTLVCTYPARRGTIRWARVNPRASGDTLSARIRHIIADIGGYTTDEIDPNALLGEDLGYDSLMQLRLVDRIRTEYPQLEDAPVDELLVAIRNVDDVVRYVAQRISEVTR